MHVCDVPIELKSRITFYKRIVQKSKTTSGQLQFNLFLFLYMSVYSLRSEKYNPLSAKTLNAYFIRENCNHLEMFIGKYENM